jgi:hypothetical protein
MQERTAGRVGAAIFVTVVILALASMAWASPAERSLPENHGHAQFWIAKGKYWATNGIKVHCCNENDCKRWPMTQTRVNPDGSIDLLNPDGSFWTNVPAREVQQSEDHDAWVCLRRGDTTGQKPFRCFFMASGGF